MLNIRMTEGVVACTLLLLYALAGVPEARAGEFQVFDATLYSNKPDLSQYGMKPLRVVYSQELWEPGQERLPLPSQRKVEDLSKRLATEHGFVALDVEHWPVVARRGDVKASLSKLRTLFEWYKGSSPKTLIGYYGFPPIFDYWRVIRPKNQADPENWYAENTALLPLAQLVDVFFPSLYTHYPDKEGWVKFAKAQVAEARRIGGTKPVYGFIWPQYHDSNKLLGQTYLDAAYWELELQTLKQHADGIVIWGGYDLKRNRQQEWDDHAPWWVVTKKFLQDIGASKH